MDLELDILNGVSKHQKLALDFVTNCDENLFSGNNKRIAKAFIAYIGTYKSRPTRKTLVDYYSSDKAFCETINGFFDVVEDEEYNDCDFKFQVDKLKHVFAKNRLNVIKEKLNDADLEDISENIKFIQKEVGAIKATNGVKAYERHTLDQYVSTFNKNYIEKIKNPDMGRGILTGFSGFDYIRNGLKGSDLIIIAGETGAGKSILLNNFGVQIYMQNNTIMTPTEEFTKGANVTYFSLEMPYDDCFRRTMSKIADVPSYGLRDAKLSRAEANGLKQACQFTKRYPYKFDIVDVPRGFTVENLELMFEEIKSSYIPDVVIIDYMGLMESLGNSSEEDEPDWLQLGQLAGKIHEFARVYAVPVLTAVQMTRMDPTKRKTGANVGLHRIGRSSLIAHHATAILQIETRENEEKCEDFVFWIIKNRDGLNMKRFSVTKRFDKSCLIDTPWLDKDGKSPTEIPDISASYEDISALLRD